MRCNVLSLQSLAGVFGRKPWLGRSLPEKDRQGELVLNLVKIPQLRSDNFKNVTGFMFLTSQGIAKSFLAIA
jgi:hypothetical protein